MKQNVTLTYTSEQPHEEGMQTTAELTYTVSRVLGVWWATEWANQKSFKVFFSLQKFSTEAYRDAHQRMSEMEI